jgi:mRNA-degrading endonuclease RelE of RelBE toxin-antitoxin system
LQARHGAFRIRVGNYRVVYSIDYEEGVVSIDDILLRNERTYRRG